MTYQEIKNTIKEAKGFGYQVSGIPEMNVSQRKINSAIRELIFNGELEISSPFSGFGLNTKTLERYEQMGGSAKSLLNRTLYSKNFMFI